MYRYVGFTQTIKHDFIRLLELEQIEQVEKKIRHTDRFGHFPSISSLAPSKGLFHVFICWFNTKNGSWFIPIDQFWSTAHDHRLNSTLPEKKIHK